MATSTRPNRNDILKRTPVYFLGIGGPNTIGKIEHPSYPRLEAVGQEITTKIKPKAIVVISAHWQSESNKIKINVAENAGIIYDFYGFPPHFYEYKFPYKGSNEIAERVIKKLACAGIETERVERGLDHGAWAGFISAFEPTKNPLDVPIVQVSLFGNEDLSQHYRLGQALGSLRDEGILIIGAGMAVHNTRDYLKTLTTGETMPYTINFDEALKEAATTKGDERQAKMMALVKRSDFRAAHPSCEHLLPSFVAAGAAGSDVGLQLWTHHEGSLSWAQYRFGEVPVV